jgi:hypothetical protein
MNKDDINYINRSTTCNEIEAKKKSLGHNRFAGEFYWTFKKDLILQAFP